MSILGMASLMKGPHSCRHSIDHPVGDRGLYIKLEALLEPPVGGRFMHDKIPIYLLYIIHIEQMTARLARAVRNRVV